jgi:hypothetical protein
MNALSRAERRTMPSTATAVAWVVAFAVGCSSVASPVAAQGTTSNPTPSVQPRGPASGRARNGDVDEFRAVVQPTEEEGRCEAAPAMLLLPSERALAYAYGPEAVPTRYITIVLDSRDRPLRYTDSRGDLRAADDSSINVAQPIGRRTMIALDLESQSGLLQNLSGNTLTEAVRVRGISVLDAPSLGVPGIIIERIRVACTDRTELTR